MKFRNIYFLFLILTSLFYLNVEKIFAAIPPNNDTVSNRQNLTTGCNGTRLICTGIATTFSNASQSDKQPCDKDKYDTQNGGQSASGVVLSASGKPPIAAVALPPQVKKGGAKLSKNGGSAVEVYNRLTGICKTFPFLDIGPSKKIINQGVVVDLTGAAYDLLNPGSKTCPKVNKEEGELTKSIGEKGKKNSNGDPVQYYVDTSKILKPGVVEDCTHLCKGSSCKDIQMATGGTQY